MLMPARGSILVVEDDALIALAMVDMLEEWGFEVRGPADKAERAVELAVAHGPGLVLMDIRLRGERDGLDAAREIAERCPAPIIFVTGSSERDMLEKIDKAGAAGVLIKPVLPARLKTAVEKVLGASA